MTEVSNDEILSTLTIDDEFSRSKKYTNSCGFDDDTLRRRDVEIRELIKLYPDMCVSWLELAWNYCEMTPKEEQDRIIASKEFEKKSSNRRNTGGVIKNAITIQTREERQAEIDAEEDSKRIE